MNRKLVFWLLVVLVVVAGGGSYKAAVAQGGISASADYRLNMRAGPGTDYGVIGKLPSGVTVILEARNDDASWVIGAQQGGTIRGWLAANYLNVNGNVWDLPVSSEIIGQPAAAQASAPSAAMEESVPADLLVPADVSTFTGQHVPQVVLTRASAIHQAGLTQGILPNVFTTVGDSTTAGNQFTLPFFYAFGTGNYSLGNYGYLGSTVHFFAGSFAATSQASTSGYSSNMVLDGGFSNPGLCSGEPPIACEIRLRSPAVAIIYLGFGDLAWSTPEAFHINLDQIINICISRGVIPVLTTLTGSETMLAESGYGPNLDAINNSIRSLAGNYQVPLIDLQAAAFNLPNQGTIVGEGVHLSYREDGVIRFNGDEQLYGKDLRELLTLIVLDDLRRYVLQ